MRVIAMVVVVVSNPVIADPKPNPDGKVLLPEIVKEAQKNTGSTGPAWIARRDGVMGMFGALAAGIVITPPAHPDGEDSPRGMVIRPPDPNDPMDIEIGTNQLRMHADTIEPWWPRDLSRSLKRGADKVWDVILPKL
jgi:hypothetical protein